MADISLIYFSNNLLRCSELSRSSRILLDVFALWMRDEDNIFYLDNEGMGYVINYCEHDLKIEYSEKTVREALAELKKKGLIFRLQNNNYMVNPDLCRKPIGYEKRERMVEMIKYFTEGKTSTQKEGLKKGLMYEGISGDFEDFE